MPLPALAGLGISVGSRLLSGLFGGRSKKKQEEAGRKASIGAAELKHSMGEDQRQARARAAASLLGQAGSDFALDPALASSLASRRSYDFSKAAPEAGAGIGSGLLSGLFGSIGDVASQYGINQGSTPMSPGQAGVPMQETVGVKDEIYEDPENYKGYGG